MREPGGRHGWFTVVLSQVFIKLLHPHHHTHFINFFWGVGWGYCTETEPRGIISSSSCPLTSYASSLSVSSTRTSAPPEEGGRKKYALKSPALAHHPSPPQPPVSALSIPHSLPQLRASLCSKGAPRPLRSAEMQGGECVGAPGPGPGGCSPTFPAQLAPAPELGDHPGLLRVPIRSYPRGEGSCARRPRRSGGGARPERCRPGHRPQGPTPAPGLSETACRPGAPCPLPLGPGSALTSCCGFPPGRLRHPPGSPTSAPRKVRDAQPLRTPAPPPPLPGRVSSARRRARASHARRPRRATQRPRWARHASVRENLTQPCRTIRKFPEFDRRLTAGGGLAGRSDHLQP